MSFELPEPEHCSHCGAFMGTALHTVPEDKVRGYPEIEMPHYVCNNPRCPKSLPSTQRARFKLI